MKKPGPHLAYISVSSILDFLYVVVLFVSRKSSEVFGVFSADFGFYYRHPHPVNIFGVLVGGPTTVASGSPSAKFPPPGCSIPLH